MKKKIVLFTLLTLIISGVTVFLLTRPPKFNLDKLHIYLTEDDINILENLKDKAHALGNLNRSDNDFVPATIKYLNDSISGKIRLKGDFLDHLRDKKWSFRVKLNDSMSDGLQVFSIQNPESRGFIDGYLYHKMMLDEGVLTNEFRFLEVYVNDESWGMYCLEEHLTTRMITNQNKPNGLLLKYTDDAFFNAEDTNAPGLIAGAKIKVYGKAKKDVVHNNDVSNAKQILKSYRSQTDTVYNNFDPKTTGLYYAICDLTTAYHAMGWINVRFYYNFDTQKMEPVAYDPYPVLEWGKPYLGKKCFSKDLTPLDTKMIVYNALHVPEISADYYEALKRISDPQYVNKFLKKYDKDIKLYEVEIQKEYDYHFDYDFLKKRAVEIQKSLDKRF